MDDDRFVNVVTQNRRDRSPGGSVGRYVCVLSVGGGENPIDEAEGSRRELTRRRAKA
jgi:hypothetical protein